MDLSFNIPTRKLVESATYLNAITGLSFKRGDLVKLRLRFYDGSSTPETITGTNLIFVLKATHAGEVLAVADSWSVADGIYTADLNLKSTELNDAVGANDSIKLLGELTYSEDGGTNWTSSQTVDVTVHNDVSKEEDVSPTPLPDPIGDTAPVNEVAAALTTGAGNAGVTWTAATAGSAGNGITVETTDDAASAETLAAEVGDAVTITRAAKARMRLQEGSDDSGFLKYTGRDLNFGTGVCWSSDGSETPAPSGEWWSLSQETTYWKWQRYFDGALAGSPIASVDMPTWPDDADYSGFAPTITPGYSSASQVETAADASLTIITAALTGDGSETFAAVDPTDNLEGGIDGTTTPPYLRVADGKLFVQEARVWKEAALSALS
jgi:hypothetical protein